MAAIIIAAWLAAMAMAIKLWLKPWPDVLQRADFVSYWTAASMVRNGDAQSMFDIDAQRTFQSNLRTEISTDPAAGPYCELSPYYSPLNQSQGETRGFSGNQGASVQDHEPKTPQVWLPLYFRLLLLRRLALRCAGLELDALPGGGYLDPD